MTLEARFAPNSSEVLTGIVDGDALLINLATGTYYSMVDAAGFIWSLIEKRHSIKEMVEGLVRRYDVSLERARLDLQAFLGGLEQEQLVVATSLAYSGEDLFTTDEHLPYKSPKLDRFEQQDWGIQPDSL